ncbi:acyl-protein synthetase, LuxE [Haliangium ochraceum]|uniref:Putative acyl-protein synthetase, LuxE n=1 Tax=Haliangium ochraceum (strain DSM 14365 / JCM 11303 / SMP-2) TaxID=502025 RepID=D0LXI9_HALO1|nr:acyl-protein synthetase, LuxE [Haliangium ochraceum]ACY17744.1 putative acyl-protein synthetase, LuxE [Haliangium ochraceum DSM 14365]
MPSHSPRPAADHALSDALAAFIADAYEPERAPLEPWPRSRVTRAAFTDMARRVLAHQAAHNRAYAGYAERLGVDLAALADPLDAPPVPTDAFKRLQLTTFPVAQAAACFRSSGTTQDQRSTHWLRTLAPMRAAIAPPFARYLLPELSAREPAPETLACVVLAPRAEQVPDSSLYFMLDELCAALAPRAPAGMSRTHFFDDALALDVAALVDALEDIAARGVPALLMGPSFSYVHFFDRAPDFRVRLPAGSRLFETGGFKGTSRRVERPDLHALFGERLGIAPAAIVGEYGMSELSSQLYEPNLRHALAGHPDGRRVYLPPPWCAVRILDPAQLTPLPVGDEGLVSFFDLANVDSVAAVVTGDMGRLLPAQRPDDAPPGWHGLPPACAGLVLRGRAPGATPKGCSLAIDMLLAGRDGHAG